MLSLALGYFKIEADGSQIAMIHWLWAILATAIVKTSAQDCFEEQILGEERHRASKTNLGKMRFAFFSLFVAEESILEAGDADALRLLQGRVARRCWGSLLDSFLKLTL